MTSGRVDLVAILALLLVVNIVAGRVTTGWVLAALHLGAAALALTVAILRGHSTEQLGLSRDSVANGFATGIACAVVIMGGIVVVTALPISRSFFSDQRFADLSGGEALYEMLFRIPVITALTEEILFRSVLLGVLLTMTTARWAVAAHAVVFGLWHVLTTVGDLAENDVTDSLAVWGRVGAVVVTVAVTGMAGVLFGWLRIRSGSIVAPWIAHTAFNSTAFLAGVGVARGWW